MSGYRKLDLDAEMCQQDAAISKMSNFSRGGPTRTHLHESDATPACQHGVQRWLDGERVCTTCGEMVGGAQIPEDISTQPAQAPQALSEMRAMCDMRRG